MQRTRKDMTNNEKKVYEKIISLFGLSNIENTEDLRNRIRNTIHYNYINTKNNKVIDSMELSKVLNELRLLKKDSKNYNISIEGLVSILSELESMPDCYISIKLIDPENSKFELKLDPKNSLKEKGEFEKLVRGDLDIKGLLHNICLIGFGIDPNQLRQDIHKDIKKRLILASVEQENKSKPVKASYNVLEFQAKFLLRKLYGLEVNSSKLKELLEEICNDNTSFLNMKKIKAKSIFEEDKLYIHLCEPKKDGNHKQTLNKAELKIIDSMLESIERK